MALVTKTSQIRWKQKLNSQMLISLVMNLQILGSITDVTFTFSELDPGGHDSPKRCLEVILVGHE